MTRITSSVSDAIGPSDTRNPRARQVPRAYHLAAAAFVVACAWAALRRPDVYRDAMQEDRFIEWLTVFTFAASGIAAFVRATRARRPFDLLIALFLIFVAGEEMSWGQRLLGLTPPAYFLEHNVQQEMNLHNFSPLGGGPKEPLTVALIGYAILLPLTGALTVGRRLLTRIGATPPPAGVIPWFLAAIVFLVWYPFQFTGEWTELLIGSGFLMSVGLSVRALAILSPLAPVFALGLSMWSARGSSDAERLACASAELKAISDALDTKTLGFSSTHRRAWTLVEQERIDVDSLRRRLGVVPCADGARATRRRFAVDPWGTAYWIRVQRIGSDADVTVYSFGPNRRRDTDASDTAGRDDILSRTVLRSR